MEKFISLKPSPPLLQIAADEPLQERREGQRGMILVWKCGGVDVGTDKGIGEGGGNKGGSWTDRLLLIGGVKEGGGQRGKDEQTDRLTD